MKKMRFMFRSKSKRV